MNTRDVSILLMIYATMLILGGWFGYVKAKSKPSLIAGLTSGLIIFLSIFLMSQNGPAARAGCLLATLTALALFLFFGKRFAKSRKMMPGGLMAAVSLLVFMLLLLAAPEF